MEYEEGERNSRVGGAGREKGLPADETYVFDVDTVGASRGSESTFVDFREESDLDKTPAMPGFAAVQRELREKNNAFALDLSRYFAQVPHEMSLPAPSFLATYSRDEISGYEAMYRHLYDQLKDVIVRHQPQIILPSFNDFLSLSSKKLGQESSRLRSELQKLYYLLPKHLYLEVCGNLDLYAAFAETIGNAKYLQDHPEVRG